MTIFDTRNKTIKEVAGFVSESGLGSGAFDDVTELFSQRMPKGFKAVICVWLADDLAEFEKLVQFTLWDGETSPPVSGHDLLGFLRKDNVINWTLERTLVRLKNVPAKNSKYFPCCEMNWRLA
jgi:hypothetical protein